MKSTQKPLSPEAQALQRIADAAPGAAFDRDALWVEQLVRAAQRSRFHGKLILNFSKGIVRHANKEESLMPPHRLETDSTGGG